LIDYQINKKFGGKRLGPYHLLANPKGYEVDYTFELILQLEQIFLDKEGNSTDITKAVTIKENQILRLRNRSAARFADQPGSQKRDMA
jgi:hypothetical protein